MDYTTLHFIIWHIALSYKCQSIWYFKSLILTHKVCMGPLILFIFACYGITSQHHITWNLIWQKKRSTLKKKKKTFLSLLQFIVYYGTSELFFNIKKSLPVSGSSLLSPHTFTKCVDAALAPLRLRGSIRDILNCINDWLILAHSEQTLHLDTTLPDAFFTARAFMLPGHYVIRPWCLAHPLERLHLYQSAVTLETFR